MDNWFNSKWFVRLVSLAFAILLFVVVSFEQSSNQSSSRVPSKTNRVETLYDMPLKIKIDEDNHVVSGVPDTVNVSLEGTTSVLTPIVMQRNLELFVDLRDLEEGTHTVDIEHEKLPNELSVFIEPKTIEVEIEERATAEFPISIDFIDEDDLPAGYELGESVVEPETVKITSSKSVMDQIGVVKVYIDVADVTEPINNREVPINVYDNQGNSLSVNASPESAVVSVEINNPSKVVPIDLKSAGELSDEFKMSSMMTESEEVEIFATSDTLEDINEISTKEIDLSEITESGIVETSFDLPEGVTIADEYKTVEVEIELEQTHTLNDVMIEIDSQDGQDVVFNNPESGTMDLTISGSDIDVGELTSDDFRLFIDTDGLFEGVYDVPVSIEGPEAEDVETKAEFKEVTIEIIED